MHPLAKHFSVELMVISILIISGIVFGNLELAALIGAIAIAISLRFSPALRGYQFTAWIIVVVLMGMFYPDRMLHVNGFDMRNKWVLLVMIQLVMFGMGTHMTLRDFAGVAKSPMGVLIGIVCHFTVMPLVGFGLTKIFHFEPEIAAGIILIGSCSSGLSSNVMAFIAKSNLALSVTVTAVTTMIAPIMTPLWMKLLAGTMVHVNFFSMMVDIIKIVLVPIGAALVHDYLKHASPSGKKIVYGFALAAVAWLAYLVCGGWKAFQAQFPTDGTNPNNTLIAISLFGFLLSLFLIGVVYHWLSQRLSWLHALMPTLAIFGIVYVTGMTIAAGHDNLVRVGWLLFLASALHNVAGYFFGYFLSRGAGLDKNSARSIAFEVGLQNGGMASGLASAMGKLGTVGLAAAVFIPWMNVSGSVLANYWRRKPVKENLATDGHR